MRRETRSAARGDFEIGRILHLKSEIRNIGLDLAPQTVQFAISDFGFEMQDSSNFEMSSPGGHRPPLQFYLFVFYLFVTPAAGSLVLRLNSASTDGTLISSRI